MANADSFMPSIRNYCPSDIRPDHALCDLASEVERDSLLCPPPPPALDTMAGHSAAVVNAGEHPAQSPAQTSFHPQSFPTNFQIPASAHSLMTAAMQDNSALFPFDEENQGFAQQSFATDNHGISSEQSIQEGQGEQAFRDLHLDLYFQQASGGEVFPDHFFTAQLPFHPRHPNHQDTSRLRSSSMSRTNSLSNGADHFASVAPTPVTPPTDHFPRMSHGLDSFYGAVYPTPQAHSQPSYPQALETEASSETDSESAPYAQLIYRALVSSKQHRLVLQDIYKWFEHNTDKTRDPKNRGWQNSIRHNLSMNGVSTLDVIGATFLMRYRLSTR